MMLDVTRFFAGFSGAAGTLFLLMAFSTDYWQLGMESCDSELPTPGDSPESRLYGGRGTLYRDSPESRLYGGRGTLYHDSPESRLYGGRGTLYHDSPESRLYGGRGTLYRDSPESRLYGGRGTLYHDSPESRLYGGRGTLYHDSPESRLYGGRGTLYRDSPESRLYGGRGTLYHDSPESRLYGGRGTLYHDSPESRLYGGRGTLYRDSPESRLYGGRGTLYHDSPESRLYGGRGTLYHDSPESRLYGGRGTLYRDSPERLYGGRGTLYHEGLFWRCVFKGSMEEESLWIFLIGGHSTSRKICTHTYLFPTLIPDAAMATSSESAEVYRGLFMAVVVLGISLVMVAGFLSIGANSSARGALFRTAGGLFLTGGLLLLCVLVLHVVWFHGMSTLERYVLQQGAARCPGFRLSVRYGPSFMMAPVGVFFCLLSGSLHLALATTAKKALSLHTGNCEDRDELI